MAPALSHQAPAPSVGTALRAIAALTGLLGAAALALSIPRIASASSGTLRSAAVPPCALASYRFAASPRIIQAPMPARTLAQDDEGGGDAAADKGASPDQIEKYVAVYRAMQLNHTMTVEQAAAAQGLTV